VNVTVFRPFTLSFNATDLNVSVTKCDIVNAQPIFLAIGSSPDYPLNGSLGTACKVALSDPCDMKYITGVQFKVVRPDGTVRLSYVPYASVTNGTYNNTYYSPQFSVDQWSATTPWTCVANVTRDNQTYEQNGTFDSNLDSNLTVAPVPYAIVSGYESLVNLTASYTRVNGIPQTNANVTFYGIVYGTLFKTQDYPFGGIDPVTGNYTMPMQTLAPGRYNWYVTAYKRFYMPKNVSGTLLIAGSNLYYSAVPQQYAFWGAPALVSANLSAVAGESLGVQNQIGCPCMWGCTQSPQSIPSLAANQSPYSILNNISVPDKVAGDFSVDLSSSDAQGSNASTSFVLTSSNPQGTPYYQITPANAQGQIMPGSWSPLEFNLHVWPGSANVSISFDNPNCSLSQSSWQDFSGSSNFVLNCSAPSSYRQPTLAVHGAVNTSAVLPGWWDSRWKYRRLLDPIMAISGQVVVIDNVSVGQASDCSDLRVVAGGGGWAYDMMCMPQSSLDGWKSYYEVGNTGNSYFTNGFLQDGYREIVYNGSETYLELNLTNATIISRAIANLELTGTARYFMVNVSSDYSHWTTVLSRVAGVNAPSGGIYGIVQGDFNPVNASYVRFIADVSLTTDNTLRLASYSLQNYVWTNTTRVNENPFYKEIGFEVTNATTDSNGNHYCSLQAMLTAPKLSNYYIYYGCSDPADPSACLTPTAQYANITRLPVLVSYPYNNTVEKLDGRNGIIWQYGNGSTTGGVNVVAQPFDASDSIIGTAAIADTLNDRVLVVDTGTYAPYAGSFGYTAANILHTIGMPGNSSQLATPFGVYYYVNYSANGTTEKAYITDTGDAKVKTWADSG
ncbi:MAG TPA: hypothetical protein PLO51_01775, partial [Candidatus Micrarchaeota archaeon]|nr:hypothetical protein [Candidatus Micrarchaeota archaeon]